MAHLVFRCDQANRVITTGVEIDAAVFAGLRNSRFMICRFCGQNHAWEVVERLPTTAALMSIKAEDFLARSIQSEFHAIQSRSQGMAEMHQRLAAQWHRLAVEAEKTADALR